MSQPLHRSFILLLTLTLFLSLLMNLSFAAANTHTKPGYISYSDVGQGEPLVLIHAYPFDKRLWKPQQEKLATHFRIITLDLGGFGQSEVLPGQTASMDDFADQVKEVLDKLHIDKAIIGGESMGGYVTLAFLKHYPERVKGLLLSDTNSISPTEETKTTYLKTADDIQANGSASYIRDFLPKAISSHASSDIRNYLLTIMNEQTPAGMAAGLRGIAKRSNSSRLLSETTLPVLIITGEEDAVLPPQQSYDMHALAKNSRLIVIQGSGHLSNLEKPDEWNKAVIEMFYVRK